MKTLSKKIIPLVFAGASLLGCNEAPEIPNRGQIEAQFPVNEEYVKCQIYDDNFDGEIDRVLGKGYLVAYNENTPDSITLKEGFDPKRTRVLTEEEIKKYSAKLKADNYISLK